MSEQIGKDLQPQQVRLSQSDKEHVEKLNEQIYTVIEEMYNLLAQNLGEQVKGPMAIHRLTYLPSTEPATGIRANTRGELKVKLGIVGAEGEGFCVIYKDPPGICSPCLW